MLWSNGNNRQFLIGMTISYLRGFVVVFIFFFNSVYLFYLCILKMNCYGLLVAIVIVILVIVVVRLSEISTRIQTIERAAIEISTDNQIIMEKIGDYVTNTELNTVLSYLPSVLSRR